MAPSPTDLNQYISIYLRDHRAGAEAGTRLARRCIDHTDQPDVAAELSRIATEIDEDLQTLKMVMDKLGVEPSRIKSITGVAGERLGRLKLNGRLVHTSPLTPILEIEGLIGAVGIKRQLWCTLGALARQEAGPATEMDALVTRADDQRNRLQALHDRVVAQLNNEAASPSAGPMSTGTPLNEPHPRS